MNETSISIGLFSGYEPEQGVKGIKNGRFQMGPKRYATEDERVPERDGLMFVNLVIQKLLHR